MKIVMLNGQNHKGSSYHIGRQIIDKISGENEITEFFFPKDLDHFCLGCYNGWGSSPIEKEYWEKEGWFDGKRPWKE